MAWTISTQAIGSRKPLLADFSVPPPAIGDGAAEEYALRDLIEHIVRQEVAGFEQRHGARRFDRVLTEREIDAGAAAGKVSPEGKPIHQRVDPDRAVAVALQGFEDGMYLIVIDEVERRDLDERVRLNDESRIAFIRLAFLAG